MPRTCVCIAFLIILRVWTHIIPVNSVRKLESIIGPSGVWVLSDDIIEVDVLVFEAVDRALANP